MTPALTKTDLIDLIRRTARANGNRPLGDRAFFRMTKLKRESLWDAGIRTYGDLCEAAGYPRGALHRHPDQDTVLAPLAALVARLGRFPNTTDREMERRNDAAFPSKKVLATATRKRGPLEQQLRDWCAGRPEHSDALRVVEKVLATASAAPARPERVVVRGHVYLFRYGSSGRDFKIGRTENVSRRHSQLEGMNPGRLRIVHVIDTDDPLGIEAYWLKRFAEKRRPNKEEIFRLTPDDVAAFKARRYQ